MNRQKIARELIAVAEILAGCEKLPEGPMRDNCEKKKKEGDKDKKAGELTARKRPNSRIRKRLEYLRKEIENESISYGEIAELEDLAEYIDPDDVLLLEWAGVPER